MIVILRLDAKLFACRKRQRKSVFPLFLSSIKSSVRFFSSSSSSLWSWKASKALAFWSLQAWLRSQSHSNSRFYTLQALISTAVPKSGLRSSHTTHQYYQYQYYYSITNASTEHSRPLPPPILRPDLVQLRLYVVGFELS